MEQINIERAMYCLLRLFDMLMWSADSLGSDDQLTRLYRSRIESSAMMMWCLGATEKDGYDRIVAMADACMGRK